MINFHFADLHCHPNLKTFGHSFSKSKRKGSDKSDLWYSKRPTWFLKCIQKLLGITRFSQADFTTLSTANVKLAFVSFYPFEKGFFISPKINNKLVATLADYVTSIGYNRVRYIQKHTDYFEDFNNEYNFLVDGARTSNIDGDTYKWKFIDADFPKNYQTDGNCITVIPTVEGAHIFNSGLSEFGRPATEVELLANVEKLKQLQHPPLFITFAHNFNNDLCGHAPSLEPLKGLVDQSKNLNSGFTKLGLKVLEALLSNENGNSVFIDIKHMSLKSRCQYYEILENKYMNAIPIIVSHGAVTGRSFSGKVSTSLNPRGFANDSINFYDEEIIHIAKSNGLFAIQLDAKRLASKKLIKKSVFRNDKKNALRKSSLIVWRQLQHIAEILDAAGLPAWNTCCIGSDFDGTIDPLEGVWTASDLNVLANAMLQHARNYLSLPNSLKEPSNKKASSEEVINNFVINNTVNFLQAYYMPSIKNRSLLNVRDYV